MRGTKREGSRDVRSAERPRRVLPLSGESHHPHACGRRADLRAAEQRVRPRPARRADPQPHRLRASIPPARALGARKPVEPCVGRRRDLRRRVPRAPLRPAPAGNRRAAARARRAHHEQAARPEAAPVGDVPGRGARGRAIRAAHQDAPCHGRRRERGRHRTGDPRREPRGEASHGDRLAAGARAHGTRAGGRGRVRRAAKPRGCFRHPAGRGRRAESGSGARGPSGGGRAQRRAHRGAATLVVTAQRRDRVGAEVRHSDHVTGRLQGDPHRSRRHGQRRRAGGSHRRPARVAPVEG